MPKQNILNKNVDKNLTGEKIVIIIAFEGFRDEEFFIPKEILERVGAEIKIASNKVGIARGVEGGETKVDLLLSDINPADFSAIIFIGGPGCLKNLDNDTSYKVAKQTISCNKVLAAICISPIILAKAGVLKEKRATVWSSPMDKSPIETLKKAGAVYEKEPVVVDEKIVTANGPASAKMFTEAIIKLLK